MGEKNSAAPAVNSWLTSLWSAAQTVQPLCVWQDVYAASGMPFVYVAAESWFDPATIHCHPRMQIPAVPALHALRQLDVACWAACGIAVTQHWFHTSQDLAEFLANPIVGVAVIWGVDGPEYGVLIEYTATSLTIRCADGRLQTCAYSALYNRSGIDVAVLAPLPVAPMPSYASLAQACALFGTQMIVRFDTPKHPLRDDQAWHVGLGAFEVMALAADHAAPLALLSTHVATIMRDLWQRSVVAQQLLQHWAPFHPAATGTQMLLQAADAFVDAQFFLDIVCRQFLLTTSPRALSHAEGDLIAAACRDVRMVLSDALTGMQHALAQWQTHCDA
jgi:hypothetical protein